MTDPHGINISVLVYIRKFFIGTSSDNVSSKLIFICSLFREIKELRDSYYIGHAQYI